MHGDLAIATPSARGPTHRGPKDPSDEALQVLRAAEQGEDEFDPAIEEELDKIIDGVLGSGFSARLKEHASSEEAQTGISVNVQTAEDSDPISVPLTANQEDVFQFLCKLGVRESMVSDMFRRVIEARIQGLSKDFLCGQFVGQVSSHAKSSGKVVDYLVTTWGLVVDSVYDEELDTRDLDSDADDDLDQVDLDDEDDGSIDLEDLSAEFFICKIDQGLEARGLRLSADEERILRTPVFQLPDNLSEQGGKELLQKAVGALTEAYARDTAGNNRQAWLQWREHTNSLYKHSKLFVSAVMQEWYLTAGRAQEKQAAGYLQFALFIVFAIVAILIGTCILM